MMISPIGTRPENKFSWERGFTLIELILVMAILSTVAIASIPSLSNFIQRQSLGDDVRRFVALTRYARSEAASLGVPVEFKLDIYEKRGWLEIVESYQLALDRDVAFWLKDKIEVEVMPNNTLRNGLIHFTFMPDGTIETREVVIIQFKQNNQMINVVQSLFLPGFEILENEDELHDYLLQ